MIDERARENAPHLVTVPQPDLLAPLRAPDGVEAVEVVLWDMRQPLGREDEVSVVVLPQFGGYDPSRLADLPRLRLVQTLSAGFEHVRPHLPDGVALANAVGVHDASTSELAVALMLASLRGIPDYVTAQAAHEWRQDRRRSLADRRVLVVGYGGIGRAVAARLLPFETEVTAVASRARDAGPDGLAVHGVDELPALLPHHDVVVLTVPLTEGTRGLVDAAFLAAMPDGALLVNVARGGVVDTGALLAELTTGRLLAALDVTDPEPLPAGHPLWSAPGVLISPHVGGGTTAFEPRAVAMLQGLLDRLAGGRSPAGVVVASGWTSART